MTGPRLEIDLDKLHHNARTLVSRLGGRGITVTGVTKATLGSPEIAGAWIRAGVSGLGDSRVENIISMRDAQVAAPMTLIRTPMPSQIDEVVAYADVSCNTELDVISGLSSAARRMERTHGVLLMVELGDLREGILPGQLERTVREVLRFPNLSFTGIGANLACRCGVSPDAGNMAELSSLADALDAKFGPIVGVVSGGNSANLVWAHSGGTTGRINNLRLGEAMLLGCEPLRRQPIDGLNTDAFTLFAEVIESKDKPSQPWGEIAQAAFGEVSSGEDRGGITQSIFAIGRQDVDPDGLAPPPGIEILASSSDHLIVNAGAYRGRLTVGTEIPFQLNYSALLRAMSSPGVTKIIHDPAAGLPAESARSSRA